MHVGIIPSFASVTVLQSLLITSCYIQLMNDFIPVGVSYCKSFCVPGLLTKCITNDKIDVRDAIVFDRETSWRHTKFYWIAYSDSNRDTLDL